MVQEQHQLQATGNRERFLELEPYVIHDVTVGSRAYGLSREGSDEDRRGAYLPAADRHWSLAGVPEQIEDPDADRVYWELAKFLKLSLQSNPNVLETLWTPIVNRSTEIGDRLRAGRDAFLSKQAYKTYGLYAESQFKKLERDRRTHGQIRPKHAMHCLRLLMSGVHLLEEGEVMVDCSDHREALLAVRDGAFEWKDIMDWRRQLEERLTAAYARTRLPDHPDYARVDRLLIEARRSRL